MAGPIPSQPQWDKLQPVGETKTITAIGPAADITGTTGQKIQITDTAPSQPQWDKLQPTSAEPKTDIFSPEVEAVKSAAASFKRDIVGGLGEVTAFLAENWGVKDPNWKPADWLPQSYKNYLTESNNKDQETRKQLAEQGRAWAAQWDQAASTGPLAPTEGLTFGKNPITKTFQVVGYALPMYAAAIAATLVTKSPATAMGLFGVQQGASTYESARKKGFTPEQAKLYAMADGAWTAGTEAVPFESILSSVGTGIIKSMVKNSLVEGTQEVIQQVGSNIIAKYGYEKGRPLFDGWLENFVGGAFLGGVGGAAVGHTENKNHYAQQQILQNLNDMRNQVDQANPPVVLSPEQKQQLGVKEPPLKVGETSGQVQTQTTQEVTQPQPPSPVQTPEVSSPLPPVSEPPIKETPLPIEKTARITMIDTEVRNLQAQIDSQVQYAAERDTQGKSIVQATRKYMDMYKQIDELQREKLDLQTNPESVVGKKHGEVRADQLRSMMAQNAKDKITALAQGVRTGKVLTKTEIKSVQDTTIGLIEQANIAPTRKAQMLRTVKNIQTQQHLEARLPWLQDRLNQLQNEFTSRSLKTEIDKTLKQSKPKIQNGILKGKTDVNTQTLLNQIREITKLTAPQVAEQMNKPNANTPLLQLAGDYKNKSVEELQALRNTINDLVTTGRSAVLEKQTARKAMREQLQQQAKDSIQGTNPSKGDRIKGFKERLNNMIAGLGRSITAWDGLMDALSSWDPQHHLTRIMDMNASVEKWKLNVEQQHQKAYENIMKAAGFSKIKQLWHQMTEGTKIQNLGDHVTQKITETKGQEPTIVFTTKPLELSHNEAIYLYAKMQEPGMRENLKKSNGYTFKEDVGQGDVSTEELVHNSLTKEQKAIGDAFIDYLKANRDRVNPFYSDKYGVEMPVIENYTPQLREGDLPETNIDPLAPPSVLGNMATPSSFKSRTGSTKRIVIQDIFKVLTQHITSIEHFMAMSDKMDTINAVFKNGDVRKQITDTYGDGILKVVDAITKNYETGHAPPVEAWLRGVERIRINLVRAKIAGKTTISIKQLFQTLGYGLDIPMADFVKNFPKTPSQIREAVRVLSQTETFKARGSSMERDIQVALNSSKFKSVKGMNTWLDAATAYALLGDKASVILGGYSVYKYYLDKTGSHEQAVEAFSKSTNSTQQSANLDQQTTLASNTGFFGRLTSTFMTGQNQMTQRVLRAAKDAYFNPTADTIKHLTKTMLIAHILMPTLYQFATNGFQWDNEDQARAALLGSLNGIYLLADGIDATMAILMNKFAGTNMPLFRSGNILTDASNQFIKNLQKLDVTDISFDDFMNMSAAIMEPLTGLPVTTAKNMIGGAAQTVGGEPVKGIEKLLGWSPYIVDKNSVSSKKGGRGSSQRSNQRR